MMSNEIKRVKEFLQGQEEIVLSARGVSKKFCRDLRRSLFYGFQDIGKELTCAHDKNVHLRKDEFWALKDISFEVRKGESIGLVGRNGAGKTTLLRILSGLIRPDQGSVHVYGRVAPLIALGAGFNPILTGQENIYANMAVLGLSLKEINEKVERIIDFAEIGDAIKAPVQSYSSGMTARLGFACAIHTEPDILLVDEVLAVGDIRFRAKCFRKIHEQCSAGMSMILVSHSSPLVLNNSQKAIHLSDGNIIKFDDTHEVMKNYEEQVLLNDHADRNFSFAFPKDSKQNTGASITCVHLEDEKDDIIDSLKTGHKHQIVTGIHVSQPLKNIAMHVSLSLIGKEHESFLYLSNFHDEILFDFPPGNHEIKLGFICLGLTPGIYQTKISIREKGIYTYDAIDNFQIKVVSDKPISRNSYYQDRVWSCKGITSSEQDINSEI